MPIIGAKGSPSSGGFGQFAQSGAVNYIEDVFSTWLYNGNSTSQTITNGIDLTGKGGLVWIKYRNFGDDHVLFDTARGATNYLITNTTDPQSTIAQSLTSFNSTGFSLGSSSRVNGTTTSPANYVSWTFRKQAKFFDVVTFTSNGSGGGTFSHNLGSVPGCVIMKSTDVASSWITYHQSTGTSKYLELQSSAAQQNATNWISVDSTTVTVASGWLGANRSIVAYLFASNAGGFGLTGTDNVISCGSFTTDGSGNATVDLGYEPQWLLRKASNEITNWELFDNMRGLSVTDNATKLLYPNLTNAEENTSKAKPTATGFIAKGEISKTYIYIAIRRGPMKVPTDATTVFKPLAFNSSAGAVNTTGFPVDSQWNGLRSGDGQNANVNDRLRGISSTSTSTGVTLATSSTAAERTDVTSSQGWSNTGFQTPSFLNATSTASWNFRRAPSFFDEVCYTGDGTAGRTITHNLTVTPEFIITKERSVGSYWYVYSASTGPTQYLRLESTNAPLTYSGVWNNTSPTSSVFTVGSDGYINASGQTYVAYLFATCAGVSKVGSYTGNGTTQTINCGFTGGARFVLVKRTDSTGNWGVLDTARGMVSGTDPYLNLNTTAAEVNANNVYTTTGGFQLVSSDANFNANGGSYIFLAVA